MSYALSWVKPSNVPYPNVWHHFQAKGLEGEGLIWYRIEDIPEERFEEAVQFMVDNFIPDEPLCKCRGGLSDKTLVNDFVGIWRTILAQKVWYACVREDTGEIAGMNAVVIFGKDDNIMEQLFNTVKSDTTINIFLSIQVVNGDLDLCKKYNVDYYMSGLGLAINTKYRGRGIAVELLKARKPICLGNGITVTNTSFTGPASSACATKAGFQLEKSMTYEEIRQQIPRVVFPNCESRQMDIKTWTF